MPKIWLGPVRAYFELTIQTLEIENLEIKINLFDQPARLCIVLENVDLIDHHPALVIGDLLDMD